MATVQKENAASNLFEERRDPRHRLGIKGSARIALSIDIIDASASGVRAKLSVALPVGTLVKIGLPREHSRHARVVWTDGDVFGCEFVEPLSKVELGALIDQVKPSEPI